jgi:very-short-patch-repair endonuclease
MVIARIAGRQHGVVSVVQLRGAGISKDGVTGRVRAGRLHRLYRGIYAVGHRRLSNEGMWLAAALACGEGAVLSHRSAAALWGLLPVPGGPVDVTVPGSGGRRRRPGIAVHRSASFTPACSTCHRGVPVATPARTIDDLRRALPSDRLNAAIRRAEVLGLPIGDQVIASDLTRSELERRFVRLCRRHRLPTPEVNVRVGPFVVDFLWRDQRLIVETDGYRFHRGRSAFEEDRARDVELKLRGYEVLRFTYRQVVGDASQVAGTVRALLT